MPSEANVLGILTPQGGGDPVTLLKPELTVGRRPSCDICLDFVNVSGKHCVLRHADGVWYVRDLGSTNGTSVNGTKIKDEQCVMPDDELAIATHLFKIDYDPSEAAASAARSKKAPKADADPMRRSLLELAGIVDEDKPKRKAQASPAEEPSKPRRASAGKSKRAPAIEPQKRATEDATFDDPLPDHIKEAPKPAVSTNDDDFFKLIEENVIEKPKP